MSWVIIGVTAGSALLSAASSVQQGKDQAKYLASAAAMRRAEAGVNEAAQRRAGRQAIGRIAAAMSEAGGIDENVLRQSAVAAELDALNVRYGGESEAVGLLNRARSTRKQAGELAGSQLLSGAASGYTSYRSLSV